MKKLFLILIILLIAFAPPCFATESISQKVTYSAHDKNLGDTVEITLTCTTAANGSLTSTVVSVTGYSVQGFYLYEVQTIPGGTGPTDDSDITITDSNSHDILQGSGTDKLDETANNDLALPVFPLITSAITLNVSNNSVDTAQFTIVLKFVR